MWKSLLLLVLAACSPADQESVRTVAAIEVTLRTDADRMDLLRILSRHAAASGLHVDDVSDDWRRFEQQAKQLAPEDRGTFYVGVWRGRNDDEAEVLADDRYHPRRVWLTFPRGVEPDRSRRFREPLLAEIRRRWPDARAIPILPWGGLPHARDLVLTGQGYRIVRSAAEAYDLPSSLPIFAPE
jgi:hypothetical protein